MASERIDASEQIPEADFLDQRAPLDPPLTDDEQHSVGRETAAAPVDESSLMPRECQGSTETGVKHQPKHRQASAGDDLSSISRSNTQGFVGRVGLEPTAQGL